ncbi:biotin transporter BioY [Leptolyngbya sp. 7M]|uniref:biotin transporter BioY n=1 Tax=Leptolyngbya sp. 7M TaxID=2812896 RepID=UPI0021F20F4E|nr:biotin transporter BioY [Leptolyngbya sp. 7M]
MFFLQSLKATVAAPTQLMWALIGLILTIGGTLLEAFIVSFPWSWTQHGVQAHSLGVTCQIAAVLLVGCLGGSSAAAISQIAYLILGLTWFNVFTQGGGFDYVHRPSFGYLLGFVPGAWICGWLAFRLPRRLENLALSCLMGLAAIHATGIGYILLAHAAKWQGFEALSVPETLMTYSVTPLPGQLALVCAVTVLAAFLRRLMLY